MLLKGHLSLASVSLLSFIFPPMFCSSSQSMLYLLYIYNLCSHFAPRTLSLRFSPAKFLLKGMMVICFFMKVKGRC